MIELPDWYKGGFPDAELCVRDMLTPFMELCNPQPPVLNALPKDYDEHLPVVTVFRGAGGEHPDVPHDESLVQVWCISDSRKESWALMEYCRQVMRSWRNGGYVQHPDGTKSVIHKVCETDGPELTPWTAFDQRAVHAVFRVSAKYPTQTVPDYQRVRRELFG